MTAPVVTGISDATFDENAVNAVFQHIDTDIALTDAEGNFNSGEITVTGLLPEDIVTVGTTGPVYRQGSFVYYDPDGEGGAIVPDLVGMITGGVGSTLTIHLFFTGVTTAIIEALLENLVYANSSNSPTATRDLTITVMDGADEVSTPDVVTITVNPEASDPAASPLVDQPGLADFAGSVAFDENAVNATPQRLDANVSFSDNDFAGGVVTVSGLLAEDVVTLANTGWIALSGGEVFFDSDGDGQGAGILIGEVTGGNGSTFTVTLNSNADAEVVDRVVEALAYANTSDGPTASRDLTINVTDTAGQGLNVADFADTADWVIGYPNARPALFDFEGDGDLDIIVGSNNGTLEVYEMRSGGYFLHSSPLLGVGDVGANAAPAFGDVDTDGDLDLLVGNAAGELSYYENVAGAFVLRPGAFPTNAGLDVRPTFGDVDNDGDLDVFLSYRDGDTGLVLSNDGGVFNIAEFGIFDGAAAFADLDGDGRTDIVVGGNSTGLVSPGNWDFNGSWWSLGASHLPSPLADVGDWAVPTFGDLDGDGDLDLAVGCSSGIHIFYNTGANGRTITVNVAAEADEILGANGHDTLWGTDDEDTLRGMNGNDRLYGDDSDDALYGGAGADILDGGSGVDVMEGGAGNDTYVVDDADDETIELTGGGTDTVRASIGWQLADYVENLILDGDDDIWGTGNALANTITGDGDDNAIQGLGGNDALLGGDGDDILTGGAGKDTLTGGAGGDTFVFTASDVVSSRAGGTVELDKIVDFRPGERDVIDLSGIDANINLSGDQAFVWGANNLFHKVAGEAIFRFVTGKATLQLDVDGDGKADFQIEITGTATGIADDDGRGGGGSGGSTHPAEGWVM